MSSIISRSLWSFVSRNNDIVVIDNQNRKMKSCIDLYLKPFINHHHDLDEFVQKYCTETFLLFIQGITLFAEDGPKIGKPSELQRRIYDNMYQALIGEQDVQHSYKVERSMFESCFHIADVSLININVEFNTKHTPIKCTMTFRVGDYAKLIDIFTKRVLNGPVRCERHIFYNDDTHLTFFKTSSYFSKHNKWIKSKYN